MGLLARRRSGNRASSTVAAEGTPSRTPASDQRPLIRPEDLSGIPGWAQVPLPEPLLPPVPFVVSRNFSEDLVAWRWPELQVGTLGHGVSDLAPQGTITVVAVQDPEPVVRVDAPAAGGDSAGMPLAHPAMGETPDGERLVTSWPLADNPAAPEIRSTHSEASGAPPQPSAEAPRAGTQSVSTGAEVPPAAATGMGTRIRHDGPSASQTYSSSTSTPRVARTATGPVVRVDPAPTPRPLVESQPPPQLPLVHLKASPPSRVDAPVPQGDRGDITAVLAEPGEAGATVGPASTAAPAAAGEPLAVAPLLGDRPPLDEAGTDHAPVSTPHADVSVPETGPDGQVPAPSLEVVQQNNLAEPPVTDRGALPIEPGAGTATHSSPGDPAPRRSGLGAPLRDLPTTAASLDAASVAASYARRPRNAPGSPLGQLPLAIAAAAGTPASSPPAQKAGPAAQAPALTYGETSSLPVVTPEPAGETPLIAARSGLLPPAPRAVVVLTPFQAIDRAEARTVDRSAAREGSALKAVIGQRHGVDLDDVAIDRSPASSAKAQAMGADAFTTEDRVVIPKSFGTLDSGPGRALLAHELTHAAQQRSAGPHAIPAENSPAGRTMEAAAVASELSYVAPAFSMARAVSPPATSAGLDDGPMTTGITGAPGPVPTPPAAFGVPGSVALPVARSQPQSIDEGALASALIRLGAVTGNPAAAMTGSPVSVPQAGGAGEPAAMQAPAPAPATAAPVQHAWKVASPSAAKPVIGGNRQGDDGVFSSRPSDKDLAKLASWLYPLISFKLRRELRSDRERAGLLTDSYRRW